MSEQVETILGVDAAAVKQAEVAQYVRFGEAIADRNGVVVIVRGNHTYGYTEAHCLEPARPFNGELLDHYDRRYGHVAPHSIVELFVRVPGCSDNHAHLPS